MRSLTLRSGRKGIKWKDYKCLGVRRMGEDRCRNECLVEESSFFTSVGHPFPAVCICTSTERPEALDMMSN